MGSDRQAIRAMLSNKAAAMMGARRVLTSAA
jgi:hypothetical protein